MNMKTKRVDLLIIGGGPAGLAAACAAREAGVTNLLILERRALHRPRAGARHPL